MSVEWQNQKPQSESLECEIHRSEYYMAVDIRCNEQNRQLPPKCNMILYHGHAFGHTHYLV